LDDGMNPLLLGGEMPHWSDHSPARGALLRELAGTARGHVLVVGPHEPELVEAIPARQVTVLVRGVPDANALASRWAGRAGIQVCCGSLEKLAAVPAYDTVVALDGLDRTGSTETADLPWAAGVAQLLAVLRPGGRLLLSVANPVGLHRLYAGAVVPDDAAWSGYPAADPTRPPGPGPLRDHLRSAGLDVLRAWSAYPAPQSPTVLLGEDALTDPDLHGFLTSALRRAGLPGGPLLADPRPLAADLLRHHLAAAVAPAWIVAAALPGHHPAPLPDGLLDAGRLVRTAAGWTVGDAGPVPAGVCLHDALLAAARTGDQPEFRALLTAWQSGPHADAPADALLLAPGGAVVPAGAAPAGGPPALREFAAALHDEGLAHLWPADGTAELLAAMSGRPSGPPPATRATPSTLRELTASHDRLAEQLAEARSQLTWYEQRTATLQSDLTRAHRIITVLKATPGGRAATAVLGGVRRGRRLATAALRRLR
jgi:SAM-dependent methyltransferase